MSKLTIKAKDFTLTDGIRGAVEEKVKKIEKVTGEATLIDVLLSAKEGKKNAKRAEVTVRYANGKRVIRSDIRTDDMYKSIAESVNVVTERLKRAQDKQRQRTGSRSIRTADKDEELIKSPIDGVNISKEKIINATVMTKEDACQEMYDTDHAFYVFRDADNDNALSLVYLREEGDFGIIEIF